MSRNNRSRRRSWSRATESSSVAWRTSARYCSILFAVCCSLKSRCASSWEICMVSAAALFCFSPIADSLADCCSAVSGSTFGFRYSSLISEILTMLSPCFTYCPSCTYHCSMRPSMRVGNSCGRWAGSSAVTVPSPRTLCCHGRNNTRNSVRRMPTSHRDTMRMALASPSREVVSKGRCLSSRSMSISVLAMVLRLPWS